MRRSCAESLIVSLVSVALKLCFLYGIIWYTLFYRNNIELYKNSDPTSCRTNYIAPQVEVVAYQHALANTVLHWRTLDFLLFNAPSDSYESGL